MIRHLSKSRRKQMREYFRLRADYLLANPWCQTHLEISRSQGSTPGSQKAIEIHHVKGRTGSLLLDVKWWKGTCWACHYWIQNNPERARTLGLIAPLGQWNQTEKLSQQKERNAGT